MRQDCMLQFMCMLPTKHNIDSQVVLQVIKDTIFNSSSMSGHGSRSELPDAAALVQQAIQASPDASLVEPMQE